MRKLYGTSYDCVAEVARMVQAKRPHEFEDAFISEWKLLLKNRSNRRALKIIVGLCFFLHMSGVYPLLFSLSNIFDLCQTDMNSNAIALIVAGTMMIASFICVITIDFVGRRKLLLFSTAGMIVMGCCMVIHLYFEYCCVEAIEDFKNFIILFASLYVGFFALGFGPVTFVIMAEIFTVDVAHLAMAVNIMINYVLMFCMGMIFYPVYQAIALVGVFAIFTSVSVLAFVFVIFAVPETKGKSHQEIENLLSGGSAQEREAGTRCGLARKYSFAEATVTEVDIKSYFQL